MKELGKAEIKERAQAILDRNHQDLAEAQELLYADDRYAVLIVLQAMDAAGKDGTIKHVMSGVNPQGCQVFSFKKPSPEELDHNFLWRCMLRLPERGRIGIFNRSYYEDVLVVKVHPEILTQQKLPPGQRNKAFWEARYDDINTFERHLVRNGTIILNVYLNVSREVQRQRFLERLEDAEKHWKFSPADLAERAFWDQYMEAYEDAIGATSTDWAPWYIVPADHKWITRAVVADILTTTIRSLDLHYPEPTAETALRPESGRWRGRRSPHAQQHRQQRKKVAQPPQECAEVFRGCQVRARPKRQRQVTNRRPSRLEIDPHLRGTSVVFRHFSSMIPGE